MNSVKELLNLSGKTAIVTGGGQGIGLGIASRLAEAGANVLIATLHEKHATAAAQELSAHGYKVTGVQADVSQETDVQRMVKTAVDTYCSIDILVNNAG